MERIRAHVTQAHLIVECKLSAEVIVNVFHLSCVLASYDKALIPGSLQWCETAVKVCRSGVTSGCPERQSSMQTLDLLDILRQSESQHL